tara:strand:- start:922 stop:1704 length:783 start_codon:yes stop_codon:yes gene_type:complete
VIKASILIANYNSANYIDQCLSSLNSQTNNNFEVIFFDDNSSDNSLEKIKKFKNIKVIENKKRTAFGSLNQINAYKSAFKKSTGEILIFLDSDDYFNENKVEKVISYFNNNSDKNILFDLPIIVKDRKYLKKKKSLKLLKTYWPYIHPQSCISIKRKIADKMFKLIEYQKYTDVWMDFRICLFSKYILREYSSFNENLTYYRQTDTNISSGFKKFSSNWWKRRKEAHSYLFSFAKDNNFKIRKNLDFMVTNFINNFIKNG